MNKEKENKNTEQIPKQIKVDGKKEKNEIKTTAKPSNGQDYNFADNSKKRKEFEFVTPINDLTKKVQTKTTSKPSNGMPVTEQEELFKKGDK